MPPQAEKGDDISSITPPSNIYINPPSVYKPIKEPPKSIYVPPQTEEDDISSITPPSNIYINPPSIYKPIQDPKPEEEQNEKKTKKRRTQEEIIEDIFQLENKISSITGEPIPEIFYKLQ